jgi:predicted DNA-binding transcriptional regulator AlpA
VLFMSENTATSRRARRVPPPEPGADALLTAAEAARFRREGLSTFWLRVRRGEVPPPIRIGPRAPRWRRADLVPGGGE